MRLSDLTKKDTKDPQKLATFFSQNPDLLLDDSSCEQLATWLREGNTAAQYALSNLKTLSNKEEKEKFERFQPFFIMGATDYNFDTVNFDNLKTYVEHYGACFINFTEFSDAKPPRVDMLATYLGTLNAIQYLDTPSEKLHPTVLFLLNNRVDDDVKRTPRNISQAQCVKEYWQGRTPRYFAELRDAFEKIPALPKNKKNIAEQLSQSLAKANIIQEDMKKSIQSDKEIFAKDKFKVVL
jgi:hypothetical protein